MCTSLRSASHIKHPSDVLEIGQVVEVKILEYSVPDRRVKLSYQGRRRRGCRSLAAEEAAAEEAEEVQEEPAEAPAEEQSKNNNKAIS